SWGAVASANVDNSAGGTHHLEVVTSGLTIEVWWDGVRQIQYRSAFAADGTQAGLKWLPVYDWLSSFDTFSATGSPRRANSLASSTMTADYSGGSDTLAVSASQACHWSVDTDAPWIALLSGTSGVGNGSVAYSIAPNPTHDWRSGHIVVSGRVLSVVQQPAPSPCTFSIWPGDGHWPA